MILPGTPAVRRRIAVAFLALGGVLAVRVLSHDLPHEQTLVFRLGETERRVPFTLDVSLTRVGDSDACAGLTLSRTGTESGDPRHTLRLPDGDYVVTARRTQRSDGDNLVVDAGASALKEAGTSRVERVTLTGGEIIVPLASRATE
jgi:hypothetical protein